MIIYICFQLLRGTFFYCQGEQREGVEILNKTDCTNAAGRHWVNYQYNFDNVFEVSILLISFLPAGKTTHALKLPKF